MIVDLTHPIADGMQTFPVPWHPRVMFQTLGRFSVEGRRTTQVTIGTHTGTHVDAPSHFIEGGATITDLALQTFLGPASLIDLSGLEAGTRVTADHLAAATAATPPLRPRVFITYDWAKRFGTSSFYRNNPFLTEGAAQWLVDSGVILLGYDTAMPDSPDDDASSDCDSPMHKFFLSRGIPLVEYVANLKGLPPTFEVSVLPLALVGLDGSPVRCVAEVT